MNKIKIKNFGPIKEGCIADDGWIDLNKVCVFIGNQGSGKSTVAKIVSTFTWIEKALVRGDYNVKSFTKAEFKKFLQYHRIEGYFPRFENLHFFPEIDYIGRAYRLHYYNNKLDVEEIGGSNYPLPQIMYVPAERNFISYVENPKALKQISDSLVEFVTEFENAKKSLKKPIRTPINNNSELEYSEFNDILYLKGINYEIKLSQASSGFQSLVPLYLTSHFLSESVKKQSKVSIKPMNTDERERFKKGVTDIWANKNLTDEQKRLAISALSARFNKTAFINIVEEPEQNLFPTSQWEMLKSLLTINNEIADNRLLLTTHSPFIISYLSIAIQAYELYDKIMNTGKNINPFLKKLNAVIPYDAMVNTSDVAIYEFDEKKGLIRKLKKVNGIPSDKNYLNSTLADCNDKFDNLLEIEQELCA